MPDTVVVAVFPGQGLDTYHLVTVQESEIEEQMVRLFGATSLTSELVSPAHALYRAVGESRRPSWFVMVREAANGRLLDLGDADARELPRMIAERNADQPV